MDFTTLSPRERLLLELNVKGMIDKEICEVMDVTQNTLRSYWHRIRVKLGNHSRSRFAAEYSAISQGTRGASGSDFPWNGPVGDWEWVCDTETRLTIAGRALNNSLDLDPDRPHPSHIYDETVIPAERQPIQDLWLKVLSERLAEFNFTHHALWGGRLVLLHNTAHVHYREGRGPIVHGCTVVLDSFEVLAQIVNGVWTIDTQDQFFIADPVGAQLLGIEPDTAIPLQEIVESAQTEYETALHQFFKNLFAPEFSRASITVRIVSAVHDIRLDAVAASPGTVMGTVLSLSKPRLPLVPLEAPA